MECKKHPRYEGKIRQEKQKSILKDVQVVGGYMQIEKLKRKATILITRKLLV